MLRIGLHTGNDPKNVLSLDEFEAITITNHTVRGIRRSDGEIVPIAMIETDAHGIVAFTRINDDTSRTHYTRLNVTQVEEKR